MNKITRKDNPKIDFDILLDDFLEYSMYEPRRGSNFFAKGIVEINEEWFPEIDRKYDGYWETNQFVDDSDNGFNNEDINELNRVEQKERTIVEKYWEQIN